MRSAAWVPSTASTCETPSVLFHHSLEHLLRGHVTYCDPSLQNKQLAEKIGIRTQISHEALLDLLSQWSRKPDFGAPAEHMWRLYLELARLCEHDQAAQEAATARFRATKLIYVPMKMVGRSCGTWHCTTDVRWRDETNVLETVHTTTGVRILGMRQP